MSASRKTTTVVSAIGILVLAAFGLTMGPRLRERWLLSRLESGTPAQRLEAARRLGELGCVAAVPGIVDEIMKRLDGQDGDEPAREREALYDALVDMGSQATAELLILLSASLERLHGDGSQGGSAMTSGTRRFIVTLTALDRIHPGHAGEDDGRVLLQPMVEHLRNDEARTARERRIAAAIVRQIDG